ncbi:MAG: pyridoxal phosphate-dependent aminotransferase [Nitrospinae bacterium]|nr:pyridoxal phosphate-dependent aminotransferase [Nitrospinota bacterium]
MEASKKSEAVTSFLAMDVLERATEMEKSGKRIIHFELGEPGFPTPRVIADAGVKAIRGGKTKYTHSLGTMELREEIARHYKKEYGVAVEPERVIVTNGSSSALFLAFAALLDAGDEVIMGDPHYSCYPNYVTFLDGVPVFVPLRESERYQLLAQHILPAMTKRTKAIVINSPANPTGAVLEPEVLRQIAGMGITVVSDEVYHGLSYGVKARSILEFTGNAFVIGGFSKRYAMTGWRIGYGIAPKEYMRPMQKLQQNFQISPGAISQEAALVALRKGAKDAERMKKEYAKRRKLMVDGLRKAGFKVADAPQGAFYVFASCAFLEVDSLKLAHRLLDEAGVAVTPGVDFGKNGEGYLRFSYSAGEKEIKEGLKRLAKFVKKTVQG